MKTKLTQFPAKKQAIVTERNNLQPERFWDHFFFMAGVAFLITWIFTS